MALHLFAMTRLAGYLWYVAVVGYGALIAYLLLGSWRSRNESPQVPLSWIVFVPPGLFIVLYYCGLWIWTILLWFQFGDDGPYEQYGKSVAAAVATLAVGFFLIRLVAGRSDRQYRRVVLWGASAMALILASAFTLDFTNRILGWTASGAAESYLAKFHYDDSPYVAPGATRRVDEEAVPVMDGARPGVRRFVLYFDDAPLQEVVVAPYGWCWWTLASSRPRTPITRLDRAIENWETERAEATELLEGVVRDYPNSEASRWASDTLDRLHKHGSDGTPRWQPAMMRRLREQAIRRRGGGKTND